jgi:hypothetical protein
MVREQGWTECREGTFAVYQQEERKLHDHDLGAFMSPEEGKTCMYEPRCSKQRAVRWRVARHRMV